MRRLIIGLVLLVPLAVVAQQVAGRLAPTRYSLTAATATAFPMLNGTAGYSLCSYDSVVMYYGVTSAVNATTHKGTPLAPVDASGNASCLPVTVTYNGTDGTSTGLTTNYLYSAAGCTNCVSYQGAR